MFKVIKYHTLLILSFFTISICSQPSKLYYDEIYFQLESMLSNPETLNFQPEKDIQKASAQCATFLFMTDSIDIMTKHGLIKHSPFEYNFDDFAGKQDWSNMFVSTLMETKKGNCHSLPILYKLIMNELGEKAYLTLSPNHMYIKVNNKRVGWYNFELPKF